MFWELRAFILKYNSVYVLEFTLPDVLEYTRSLPLPGNESVVLFGITFDVGTILPMQITSRILLAASE